MLDICDAADEAWYEQELPEGKEWYEPEAPPKECFLVDPWKLNGLCHTEMKRVHYGCYEGEEIDDYFKWGSVCD